MFIVTTSLALAINLLSFNFELVCVLFYPFRGLAYFAGHPHCWRIFSREFGVYLSIVLGVLAIFIGFQLIVDIIIGPFAIAFHPPLYQISLFVSTTIYKCFFLPRPLKETFDYTICQQFHLDPRLMYKGLLEGDLYEFGGETLCGYYHRNIKAAFSPFVFVFREILYIFLHLIPFVGPVIVAFLKAARDGFSKHGRYFYLKGYTPAEVNYLWYQKRHLYFSFGLVAVLLELIPFANFVFFYSNTMGAALWARDIEVWRDTRVGGMEAESETISSLKAEESPSQ